MNSFQSKNHSFMFNNKINAHIFFFAPYIEIYFCSEVALHFVTKQVLVQYSVFVKCAKASRL